MIRSKKNWRSSLEIGIHSFLKECVGIFYTHSYDSYTPLRHFRKFFSLTFSSRRRETHNHKEKESFLVTLFWVLSAALLHLFFLLLCAMFKTMKRNVVCATQSSVHLARYSKKMTWYARPKIALNKIISFILLVVQHLISEKWKTPLHMTCKEGRFDVDKLWNQCEITISMILVSIWMLNICMEWLNIHGY